MSNENIRVGVGARFIRDGEIHEVMAMSTELGREVITASGEVVCRMSLNELLHDTRNRFIPTAPTSPEMDLGETAAVILGELTERDLRTVRERAEHVREMLTGYRSGNAELSRPGEPRPSYDPELPLETRYLAKAQELGRSDRTVKRWASDFNRFGEAGLVDCRYNRETSVDPRWIAEALAVVTTYTEQSRPTRSAVIRRTNRNCEERFGPGEVTPPSRAMAYRILAQHEPRHPLFRLSTKRNRDIAQRSGRPYGKLPTTRPGEYVYLDTTPLDVFAMDPLTLRWVGVELTVAMDRYTRCIVGVGVTAVSTKVVDIAAVLFECYRPRPAPADWPPHAVWPEHGVPRCVMVDPDAIAGPLARRAGPAIAPETIVVDHGKVYISEHITSVCARRGISIQPARVREGRDKGPVERFFRTIREDLLQHLDGYKGPDVYSRGVDVEKRAFYYIDELEEIIREWIAAVYHHGPHGGAVEPGLHKAEMSPAMMYQHGLARAGYIEAPQDPELAYEFLQAVPRTIQHYGVEIKGRIYEGDILSVYHGKTSPYTGRFKNKWPIYLDANDIRYAYFRHPTEHTWHTLTWEHADGLTMPMAEEALEYCRKLAAREHRFVDHRLALDMLLTRWEVGSKSTPAERRMAINMARQDRTVLSSEAKKAGTPPTVTEPAHSDLRRRSQEQQPQTVECGDDDTNEEIDHDYGEAETDDQYYHRTFDDA